MNAQRTKARTLRSALLGITLLAGVQAWADPPTVMRYQARLTGSGGTPLAGNQSLTFAIYDQATGGALLWNEGPLTINLANGNLDILLGQVTPLTSAVVNAQSRHLEITVGSTVLSPRHQLSSVPYSLVTDRLGTKTLGEITSDNDARYPRLSASNTFNGNQSFNGDVSHSGRGNFSANNSERVLDVAQGGAGEAIRGTAGSVGLRGEATGPGGAGVKGEAAGAGGVGMRGEAMSTTGGTIGAHAKVHSSDGTAGVFDNTAGGKVLSGQVSGVEKFGVDGNGNAQATGKLQAGGNVEAGGHVQATGNVQANGNVSGGQIVSSAASGTPPLTVGSSTKVSNLNADLLDGQDASAFALTADLSNKVSRTGDSMTGTLNLPMNGLVAGATQLVIAGGNVGIGTATPATTLEVSGTLTAAAMAAAGNVQAAGNVSGGQLVSNAASGTPPLIVGSGTKVSNLNADFLDGQDASAFALTTDLSNKVSRSGDSMSGALILPTDGLIAGATQMVIAGGNVGIGTAVPATTLDVVGTAKALSFASNTYTSPGPGQAVQLAAMPGSPAGLVSITGGNGSQPGASGGNVVLTAGAGNGAAGGGNVIIFPGTGSPVGNVGIATNTPMALLDVNGTAKAVTFASNTYTSPGPGQAVQLLAAPGSPAGTVNIAGGNGAQAGDAGGTLSLSGGASNGSAAGGNVIIFPGPGTPAGNVGIATNSPTSLLDVNGTAKAVTFASNTYTSPGPGQAVQLLAAPGSPAGALSITGGSGATSGDAGGAVVLTGGAGNGAGAGGNIVLFPGTGGTTGNIGIAINTPSNILTVVQDSPTDPIADAWTIYSSGRWKANIRPIEGALETVLRLRGVSFDWKASGRRDIGLVAEEVGEVVPEVVVFEENGHDARSVDYARLVAIHIEALKEQQQEIEALRETFNTLAGER